MDPPSNSNPKPLGVSPRHLGLPRRQSYDPLSSTKGSLSLGKLPPPTFGSIPAGLRSVPAVETTRHFGSSAFRNVSAPLGDGQRTPGGSLVIGAEVFGFGKPAPKDARERWGTGSVDGADEAPASKVMSDWPSEFEPAATATATAAGRNGAAPKSKHRLESLSADFSATGLPHPSGSSIDLRPSSPAGASMSDPSLRAPSRSSLIPPHSTNTPASDRSQEASPLHSGGTSSDPTMGPTSGGTSAGGLQYRIGGDSSTSPLGNPYVYPFQPPDPSPPPLGNPYFTQSFALPMGSQHPRTGRDAAYGQWGQQEQQLSPEDLAFGLRNVNLGGPGGGPSMGGGRGGQPHHQQQRSAYSPEPYGGPRDSPGRQNSTGFQPYFMATPASPYVAHQDPYSPVSFGAPSGFYSSAMANGGAARRDSVPQPGWSMAIPPFAFPAEYSQPSSNVPSRQGSFSYTPSGLPQPSGLSPYAPGAPSSFGGSSHLDQVSPIYGGGPQLGQQHQIILGRAVRGGVEYIAPGPVQPHGYGAGYAPDMRSLRSPMLEEFRSNRNRSWELPDLVGHIVEFSGDQLGSRHIQTKLDTATTDERNLVFHEILPNMLQLSTDVFANYVIQKFFEQGSQVQKTAMAKVLEGHVLPLSLQMYGCRVVQKALEYVLVDQQVRLVKELDGHVLKCARDAQSNHVVQRALERVPPEHLTFITDACLGQVHSLATHPYGCRVLQRIFENCPPPQTRALLDELHRYTQNLIQDQYGNYVVQWVIEKGEQPDRSLVVSKVFGQVLPLSQQKFASNVVEKCIIHSTDEERYRMIEEVLAPAHDGSSIVKTMLAGAFSNYVIQQALKWATGPQRETLFAETALQLGNLRKYSTTYSKHLVTIEKLLQSERERGSY
ncbi:hypothetical protein JCM21900_004076 [Sporobolomyces salmonicolor]